MNKPQVRQRSPEEKKDYLLRLLLDYYFGMQNVGEVGDDLVNLIELYRKNFYGITNNK